ncbi:MAG: hypothetical protein H6558_18115 [Lewinellaceae bacterium]|nr:hypothetical protein [Lewinellaceae bacterium]MCB9291340.1 hypothetical protein [Lewinellaceae bacterium]
MLRYLFAFIVFLHGLIHLLGFVKAFHLSEVSQLTQEISRPAGLLWLAAAILFLATGAFYLSGNERLWPLLAFVAIVLSQVLIFLTWQDAKFGTIANVIILLVAIPAYAGWSFEQSYRQDVKEGLERTNALEGELLTEAGLQPLPAAVQRYLRYAGAVGKPKVKNMRVTFKGQMRGKGQDWFDFTAEQYNFYDDPTRLFFMKASVKGLPANGYHAYKDKQAGMTVKALSLFPVVELHGEEMFQSETVTIFNDMCLMAPATLISDRIKWEPLDEMSARAVFTNQGISISATLYFNEQGQLIDFVSDDRYDVAEMKQYRFSTPVSDYRNFGGYNIMSFGEAVWHYPDGEFVYGKFDLQRVEYNVTELK